MKTMLKRGAGVLMPIFSLPSPYGIGTFGRAAYEFIDQLKRGRQTYWQVLPMGPTCYGDSPYQSYSAFAGNPYFIDLDTLKDEKLLTQDEIDACWWCDKQDQVKYDALYYYRFPRRMSGAAIRKVWNIRHFWKKMKNGWTTMRSTWQSRVNMKEKAGWTGTRTSGSAVRRRFRHAAKSWQKK